MWITLQLSDLYDYLAAPQVALLKSLALDPSQTNPIDEIIDDVTHRIRAEISGNPNNILSENRTEIPQELKSFACYLVLEYAQTRLCGLKLTADQVRLAEEAKDYLKRIAQGEVPIEYPENGTMNTFSKNLGCEVVHSRHSIANYNNLQGL